MGEGPAGDDVWEPCTCVTFKAGLVVVRLLGECGWNRHTEDGALPPLAIERLERREGSRGGSKEARGGIKPGLCKVWCLGGQERKGFQGGRHQLCQILLSGKDGDREASFRFEHGAPWQPG